jgi:hypothetical protein
MSFNPSARRSPSAPATTENESWKSQGFLNLYLPANNESGRAKLGAIGLKMSKPAERKLMEFLEANPEGGTEAILAKLTIEYRPAGADESAGFDLGPVKA